MLKILKEKPWSYALMVDGERALLTIMMNYGGAENDMTIELADEEKCEIFSDLDTVELIVKKIRKRPEEYLDREVSPPVWPKA